MRRLGGWVVAAATAGLMLCAPAEAVLPAPGLELGGGGPDAGKATTGVLVTAQVGADGRTMRIAGSGSARCPGKRNGRQQFDATVTLAEDGTFSAQRVRSGPVYSAIDARGRVDVSGTVDGATASGVIRFFDVRGLRGAKVRCRDVTGAFTLRDPGRPTGPAVSPPAPGTRLYGLTDDRVGGLRGAVFAQIAANGKTFEDLSVRVKVNCGGFKAFDQAAPVKRFRADGSFDTRERFPVFFANATERWRARTRGTFLAGGTLVGRFDATIRTTFTEGQARGRRTTCSPAAGLRFWAVP